MTDSINILLITILICMITIRLEILNERINNLVELYSELKKEDGNVDSVRS